MTGNSFLETGVLIGHNVLLDPHYTKCRNYINKNSNTFYTSQDVRQEYTRTKTKVIRRLSTAVLDHVRDLKNHTSTGYLGPMDINQIRKKVLDRRNDAYRFLDQYYRKVVNNGINKPQLEANLRNIARDLSRITTARENQLDSTLTDWTQLGAYTQVDSTLKMIHQPDRSFLIQAHDLASNENGQTEFATANPKDFINNGRKSKILRCTKLDDIVDLSL